MIASFWSGLTTITTTYSKTFTTAVMTTEEGAQIHPRIAEHKYSGPIDGDFLICAPSGKYMLTSNVREWVLLQVRLLGGGLFFLLISFLKSRKTKQGNCSEPT